MRMEASLFAEIIVQSSSVPGQHDPAREVTVFLMGFLAAKR